MSSEKFAIGQRVVLVNHSIEGVVIGVYTDRIGTSFNVEYADTDGRISARYFAAGDLSPA